APAQGFMCIATSSGSAKFMESCKTTASSPNIIRSAAPENYLTISSSNATNGLGGEAVVQITNDAHNGYDLIYDMPFLSSPYEDATNIWTSDNDGKDLLLNALDGTNDILDIPLSVVAGTPGDQLLSFKGMNSFTSYSCAWIEDLATGEKINLKDHDTYSFPANAAGEKHNFNLHFERTGNCPLSDQNITPSLDAMSQVFVNNGNILAEFGFEEKTDVSISIFNAIGQQVSAAKNVSVGKETIALDNPDAHGVYLVRITKGDEVVTKKIYY
ncbi:MAG TPA: T9SS type A sorting domain-containing protein, partial [Bacteroidia bacterium]|nr:T9SS type A sorting domain-containing protein [Bacteroidia bacterium]